MAKCRGPAVPAAVGPCPAVPRSLAQRFPQLSGRPPTGWLWSASCEAKGPHENLSAQNLPHRGRGDKRPSGWWGRVRAGQSRVTGMEWEWEN